MERLSEGEITVILGLLTLEGMAATEDLAGVLRSSEQYVRNNIYKLRKKGIVTSLRPSQIAVGILFGAPILEAVPAKAKQKVHVLNVQFNELVKKYPEILEYSRTILKTKTPEELKRQIEKTKEKLKKEGG